MKTPTLLVASVLCLAMADSARATVVGCDADTAFFQPVLEARFRSFRPTGGQEIYLGVVDLGCAENRSATDVPWVSGVHPIVFSYDPAADQLRATAAVQGQVHGVDFNQVTARVGSTGSGWTVNDLNAVRVTVWDREGTASQPTTVRLTDLMLSVNGQPVAGANGDSVKTWWVSGQTLGQGFRLTGNLELDGAFSSRQELRKISMEVGHMDGAYSPVPEAPTFWAGLPLLLGAAAAWRRRQGR